MDTRPRAEQTPALAARVSGDQARLPPRFVAAVFVLCASAFAAQLVGVNVGPALEGHRPGEIGGIPGHLAHTILEWSGVCLAAFTALLAMLRYSLQRDATAPIIGTALLCAASMDAFHLQVTHSVMLDAMQVDLLAPYSWLLSRTFTALTLGLGACVLLLRGPPLLELAPPTREPVLRTSTVLLATALLSMTLPAAIMSLGLPATVFPDQVLPRPYDLGPALVFGFVGWFAFRRLHRITGSVFAHALLVGTVPLVCTQLLMAFGSSREFDSAFYLAHGLKLVAYGVLMSGVLIDYIHIHQNQQRELAQRRVAEQEARDYAEVLANADRAKSAFLASMSHEIRTPMSGVLGMSTMLLDTGLDAEQRRMAETVQASSESLLALINDILDLSKVEAGQLDLEELELDLREILDDVVGLLGGKAVEKALGFTAHIAPDVPPHLVGDPGRLRQVLMNLVGNALKFTAEGHVEVRVSLVAADDAAVELVFSVSDTGIGVRPGDEQRLFDSFTQADRSTSRNFGGTGLGLAICRQLVELMGGTIGAEPGRRVGARFWFTVRLARQPVGLRPRAVAPVEARDGELLVCGVEGRVLEALCEQLVELGCRPRSVPDAEPESGRADGSPPRVAILGDAVDAGRWRARVSECRLLRLGTDARDPGPEDVDGRVPLPLCRGQLCDALHALFGSGDTERPAAVAPVLPAARVLVAEDNVVNRQVIELMLSRLGIRAEFAADGRSCLERVRAEAFDLILMDCQMPGMDGFEATAAIRAEEASGRRTPIIALTANALAGDRDRCLAAGMDDYLSKPVAPGALATMLASYLLPASEAGIQA